MNLKNYLLFFFLIILSVSFVQAPSILLPDKNDSQYQTAEFYVNFFYSETCPHCRAEKAYLGDMEKEYPELKVRYFLVSDYAELLSEFAAKYNTTTAGVPRTFIGDTAFIGFTAESGETEWMPVFKAYLGYQNQITNEILKNLNKTAPYSNSVLKKTPSPISYAMFILIIIYALSYLFINKKFGDVKNLKHYWVAGFIAVILLAVFIFMGSIPKVAIKEFADGLPFPLFVFIIALADSFNPCAFTIFIILLSLLTYTRSRRDMLVVGAVFIMTSALMYFIFIVVMIVVGSWALGNYGQFILLLLGGIIIIAGVINIKDYFFYKRGVSLTIDDKYKHRIVRHAGSIVGRLKDKNSKKAFFLALFATFLFAVVVNIVELGCSAILPAVYMTSLLNKFGVIIGFHHIAWTLFYSIVYVIPLFAILLNFIYTFKSARMTEEQGKLLKLISGLIMIIFGIIMLLRPELLSFG